MILQDQGPSVNIDDQSGKTLAESIEQAKSIFMVGTDKIDSRPQSLFNELEIRLHHPDFLMYFGLKIEISRIPSSADDSSSSRTQ